MSDSIFHQLATLLASPVLEDMQTTDQVIIVAEICSSSRHPLTDRRLHYSLPRDKPIQLLTVNPDRMTRRADEVDTIIADVEATGGRWHSSGFALGDKGIGKRDWFIVADEMAEAVKTQLRPGKYAG
jgi:hypothetical protein